MEEDIYRLYHLGNRTKLPLYHYFLAVFFSLHKSFTYLPVLCRSRKVVESYCERKVNKEHMVVGRAGKPDWSLCWSIQTVVVK